ncbi:MAG: hypothetical protein ABJL67_09270 [Sulfitobacter sp.]
MDSRTAVLGSWSSGQISVLSMVREIGSILTCMYNVRFGEIKSASRTSSELPLGG